MLDPLIDFLNVLGRWPGGGLALSLRDSLRESRYRRARLDGAIRSPMRMLRSTRRAGGELAAACAPRTAAAMPMPVALPASADAGRALAAPVDDADRTRTLLRLRPAGRDTPMHAAIQAPPPAAAPAASPATADDPLPLRGSGFNPLVDAATPLLTLAAQLRRLPAHGDPRALRVGLAQQVVGFHAAAREAGVASEPVLAARYVLCTLLDEAVLATPWGADSPWSQHSLLSQFHAETWGGDKFFQILDRLLADPARHRDLLELMALCLALGLQGRFGVADGGLARLQDVRLRLHEAIRGVRGEPARELSPQWQPAPAPRRRLARLLPLWVAATLAALALLAAYALFSIELARRAEPVHAALARLGQDAGAAPAAAVPAVPRTLTLREALAADIRGGRVDVIEQARGSTVEIRGDGFFASGSADIDPAMLPLLARVAAALNRFDAPVQVSGHTDNQPLAVSRRLRFATNWELSQARAEAVAAVLARQFDRPARLNAEGRGDADPKAANDSAAGRAQNRRVDITLLNPAAALPADAAAPLAWVPGMAGANAAVPAAGDERAAAGRAAAAASRAPVAVGTAARPPA